MSDLIRVVKGPWTPQPQPSSVDAAIPSIPDTYRFLQNQIESAQRQNQNAVSRTIRAGNLNSAPKAADLSSSLPLQKSSSVIMALLIK